jgi:uncharacterized protein YidB (DUF937 family)
MVSGSHSQEALSCDTLSVITDRLKLLATRKTELWWDIGCLLDAMATQGVAGATGRDWAARAQQIMGIDRSEARRMRRISSLFSRELAMRFGIEKLELLVKLVETLPEAPPVMDPLRVEVLSHREDGTTMPVTFAECTLDDLRFTIKITAARKTAGDVRFGPLGEVRDALDKALRKAMARKAPKVKLEGTHVDRPCLSLIDLDPGDLDVVGRALIAHAKARKPVRKPKRAR